ncbi:MAG: hypothetical protein IPL78_34460 [Chloroflexi bacterium]|nr:hypothetical protein [Chloroflexota bacterium]
MSQKNDDRHLRPQGSKTILAKGVKSLVLWRPQGWSKNIWAILFLYSYWGLGYNPAIIVANLQQAKKKPQITELLTEHSYSRGWRYGDNYDQFLSIGQVAQITPHRQHQIRWRLAMTPYTPRHKPHLNTDLPGNGLLLRQACSPASNKFVPQSKSLFTGGISHCDNNGKSQVFVVPGF